MTDDGDSAIEPPQQGTGEPAGEDEQQQSQQDDEHAEDDQTPEYELTDYDRPPSEDEGDADDVGEDAQPEYELVDDEPPPPDRSVIEREAAWRHWIQQNWILGTFIALLIVVVISDIGLSAGLAAKSWSQVKPEIDYIRNALFAILLVIVGYFFGERRHR